MIFLEEFARPLLVSHAISASVLVGATSHHLLWTRAYRRADFTKIKAERRFALIATLAFIATFLIGNLIYPTYKVRVRSEYFDNPAAVSREMTLRAEEHRRVGVDASAPISVQLLTSIARLFDIKEHWVALGCAASVLLLLLSRAAHPKDHPRVLVLYLALSAITCGTAWFGAVVGLLTASFRSVGGVS